MILLFPHPETAPLDTPRTAPVPSMHAEHAPPHTDYDLQPLPTESLAHYIEYRLGDERFRVS